MTRRNPRLDRIAEAFRNGTPISTIAKRNGITEYRVRKVIEYFGLDPARQLDAVIAENARLRAALAEREAA